MTGLRRAPGRRGEAAPAARTGPRRARVAGVVSRSRHAALTSAVDEDRPGRTTGERSGRGGAAAATEPPPSAAEAPARSRAPVHRRVPAVALLAVTVVATALALWSVVEAQGIRTGGAAANRALTDVATTEAVTTAVRRAVESAFSYDHGNTDRTREAAREVLIGRAVQQYDELYAQVKQQAQARRLVLTTAVRSIGVMELRGDRAVVLVFVDQQIVQTGDGAHTSGASQMSVSVVRSNGTWLIEDITVL